jgi:hypothetical protein
MNIVERTKQKWNNKADEYNQWDALGSDEMLELIIEEESISNDAVLDEVRVEELKKFFMWFRDNGEKHIGISVEELIQKYISEHFI